MMKFSKRIESLNPSYTLQVSKEVRMRKLEVPGVIDFGVGQPDFKTPDHVKLAGKQAIDSDKTGYTAVAGIDELRKIISDRMNEDGLQCKPAQIIVCSGAKAAVYMALAAVLRQNDEVLIPSPYWVSYPEMATLLSARSVFLPTSEDSGFRILSDQLTKAITRKSRVLILNNPSNPTGAAYEPDQLAEILRIAHQHKLFVISDEIYSKIIFDNFEYLRACKAYPAASDRIITIDGASKAYSMTGWRIGFAAGHPDIIAKMIMIQEHLTSNPCSISQYATLAAYTDSQDIVRKRTAEFQERRDVMLNALLKAPGVTCFKPQGAFYLFPNVSRYYGSRNGKWDVTDSFSMCKYLLYVADAGTVPGKAFGQDDYIRISFATSMQNINTGIARIVDALEKLEPIK